MNRYSMLLCLGLPLATNQAWAQATLAEAAAKVGLNIGVATNSFNVSNTAYANAVKGQFNLLVCENEMKFESTERSQGNFSFTGGDAVVKFAQDNKMRMRGHTFVWHSQSGWASSYNGTRQQMQDIMKNHIEKVGGHFKGQILEWDVLNEITDDGNGNALRNSFWKSRIGEDYVDSAFTWAQKTDPAAYLYYNDYGGDAVNGKSTAMHNLVKKLQTSKIPIHGIGLQSHLGTGLNGTSIASNVKRFGELGVRISMTEIDITSSKTSDWVNLLNACLENFNCVSFVAWGLADGSSWLSSRCNGCLLYSGSANSPSPKTEIINALIDAMSKANPDVVAKRKAFAARIPGPNGLIDPTSVQFARRNTARHNLLRAAAVNGSATPVLTWGVSNADLLGRSSLKTQPPAYQPALGALSN